MTSLPKPSVLPTWVSVNPRTLRPLESPPEHLEFPSLPSPPRIPSFSDHFSLSTHIIPAACPRSYPDLPLPASPPETANKQERRDFLLKTTNELFALKAKQAKGELGEGSRKVLWNCINRYVRRDLEVPTGITLFFTHANGFPKEIWEPTIAHLLSSPSGRLIDEIWCWEAIQHGDSALVNQQNLGGMFDWSDNARDILNFLLNYLPSSASPSALPTHLTRLPTSEGHARKADGWKERKFVTVGHSYGGTSSTLAAVNVPALFPSLILVDPVIAQPGFYNDVSGRLTTYTIGALQRRDHWPSREEAYRLFSQVPFFRTWDPAVLKIYVECGLALDAVRGGVKLKQPGVQEALVFSESLVSQEVWELLQRIDTRVELRWVLPGVGSDDFANTGDYANQVRAWRRPENASNVRIAGAGHLIAQEKPEALAEDIHLFLQRKYGTKKASL